MLYEDRSRQSRWKGDRIEHYRALVSAHLHLSQTSAPGTSCPHACTHSAARRSIMRVCLLLLLSAALAGCARGDFVTDINCTNDLACGVNGTGEREDTLASHPRGDGGVFVGACNACNSASLVANCGGAAWLLAPAQRRRRGSSRPAIPGCCPAHLLPSQYAIISCPG